MAHICRHIYQKWKEKLKIRRRSLSSSHSNRLRISASPRQEAFSAGVWTRVGSSAGRSRSHKLIVRKSRQTAGYYYIASWCLRQPGSAFVREKQTRCVQQRRWKQISNCQLSMKIFWLGFCQSLRQRHLWWDIDKRSMKPEVTANSSKSQS